MLLCMGHAGQAGGYAMLVLYGSCCYVWAMQDRLVAMPCSSCMGHAVMYGPCRTGWWLCHARPVWVMLLCMGHAGQAGGYAMLVLYGSCCYVWAMQDRLVAMPCSSCMGHAVLHRPYNYFVVYWREHYNTNQLWYFLFKGTHCQAGCHIR